jgi:hypothetical protein
MCGFQNKSGRGGQLFLYFTQQLLLFGPSITYPLERGLHVHLLLENQIGVDSISMLTCRLTTEERHIVWVIE